MEYKHTPVMLKKVIEYLQPQPGQKIIDCTLGGGGYTLKIAKMIGPTGKLLAIDLDRLALDHAKVLIKEHGLGNVILAQDNFVNLEEIIEECFEREVDGIVFDLGLSSAQLDDETRGFSFQKNTPLNMAFEKKNNNKTKIIVNKYKEKELADVLYKHGEERYSRRIAKAIVQARKNKEIQTTQELVEIIKQAVPIAYQHQKIHFATRTFQALRIETNQELKNIEKVLPVAIKLLKPGGKIIIISFHSLEDRIVKNFFKQEAKDCLCPPTYPVCKCHHQAQLKIITKKVVKPSAEEIENNPRARSAKLRVAIKL